VPSIRFVPLLMDSSVMQPSKTCEIRVHLNLVFYVLRRSIPVLRDYS
jgi:hypothetical protein